MAYLKMDPPGTFCQIFSVLQMVKRIPVKTFIEIGCGAGDLSKRLLQLGYRGTGLDFSQQALEEAKQNLKEYIDKGEYSLLREDIMKVSAFKEKHDFALSMMVMEHVEDDIAFISHVKKFVKNNGHLLIGVPGRKDCWGIEDEIVGHFRRYDKSDLRNVLEKAGLKKIEVWSIAVPISNILYNISNLIIGKSKEIDKKNLSMRLQTETSGIREIPYKTVFPSWCRLILNRWSLFPVMHFQRLFYNTNLGLIMLARAQNS